MFHFVNSKLSEEELEKARKRGRLVIRLRHLIQDVTTYLIFLIFLSFIAGAYRDPDAYHFSKAVENTVIGGKFKLVSFTVEID